MSEIKLFGNLESEAAKNLIIEKITFKVVQIKFLAMHFTNLKLGFDIFMVGYLLTILIKHDPNYFWHKRNMDNFESYNVLLAIAANIHVLIKTDSVLIKTDSVLIKTDSVIQGHILFLHYI